MASITNLMGFGQSNSLTGGVYTLDLSISSAWFLVALLILPIKFVMIVMAVWRQSRVDDTPNGVVTPPECSGILSAHAISESGQ